MSSVSALEDYFVFYNIFGGEQKNSDGFFFSCGLTCLGLAKLSCVCVFDKIYNVQIIFGEKN